MNSYVDMSSYMSVEVDPVERVGKAKRAAGAGSPTPPPSIMTADTGLETQGTGVDVEWTFDFGNSMEGSRTRTRGGWTKRLWRGGQLEERIQEHVAAQSPPWPPKRRYTRSQRDFGVVVSSR